jgi:cystathionine beta-lyase/cystathionine gamma-synthase
VRVRYRNQSALELAGFLAKHPRVRRVNYPGLPDHPSHARARRWLAGSGGIISFELEGEVAAAERLIARASIPIHAPSLGGPETLITRPATTSHAGLALDVRARQGISDHLIRLSVGLEATADLIEDLGAALE